MHIWTLDAPAISDTQRVLYGRFYYTCSNNDRYFRRLQFIPLVEGFLVAEEPSHVIKRRIM